MKKLSQAIVLAGAMTAGLVGVQTAQAEVSASAAVANNYIFRGLLLGSGTPAVSGALDYSHESGAYAGVWGTSGDTLSGDEYDVYFGFGGESGDFSYDVNVLSYLYPARSVGVVELGEFVELTASVGFKSFGLSVTVPVADSVDVWSDDYVYTKVSYGYEKFGIAVGNNSFSGVGAGDYTHVDLSYSFNDNVTFTASQLVDGGDEMKGAKLSFSDDLLLQISYSLPIEL